MLTEEQPYCKLVSNTAFIKTRGTNRVYEEAIEASAKFNKRLVTERKTRLPFLDSQTTVAQSNCMIWNKEHQRVKPSDDTSVLHYQVKKWFKRRRITLENGDYGMLHRTPMLAPTDLIQHTSELEQLSNFITNSQHIAYTPKPKPQPKQIVYSKQSSHNSQNDDHSHGHTHDNHKSNGAHNGHSNNHNNDWHMEEEENSKNDNENDSEEDDELKRRKKKGGRSRKNPFDADGIEKSFVCDQCGAKYKTRPGLSYHVQKTHNMRLSVNPSGTGSPMTVAMNKITREPVEENENTNSLFDSVYDDNSSSMPQGSASQASASTPLNQNTNSSQPKLNGTGPVKCGVCFGIETEPRGQHSTTDKFITCSECVKQFHQTACLGFNVTMIESVKKYKWLCIECKRCTVCGNSENDDKLLFCDDCDRGYHMYCLTPPLTEAPPGDWRCEHCTKSSAPGENK